MSETKIVDVTDSTQISICFPQTPVNLVDMKKEFDSAVHLELVPPTFELRPYDKWVKVVFFIRSEHAANGELVECGYLPMSILNGRRQRDILITKSKKVFTFIQRDGNISFEEAFALLSH